MTVVTDPRQSAASGDRDTAAVFAAAACGEERCPRRLVESYGRRVFALAKARRGSVEAAEEIAQPVFVTVAATLGRGGYPERGRFEPWRPRIATNRIRGGMRGRARRPRAAHAGAVKDARGAAARIGPATPLDAAGWDPENLDLCEGS